MFELLRDLRFALRSLWAPRNRIASTAAILALTLGIGATTAIFSVVEPVLLRSLPYRDADRLVALRLIPPNERNRASGGSVADMNLFRAWRSGAPALEDIAAYATGSTILTGRAEAVRVPTIAVTANVMSFLGVNALIGRTVVESDDHAGAAAVVILSEPFWARHFNRDPLVVGRTMSLDGRTFEIVGVMPAGFRVPNSIAEVSKSDAEVWLSVGLYAAWKPVAPGQSVPVEVLARIKRGVSLQAAERELSQVIVQADPSGQRSPNAYARPQSLALVLPLSHAIAAHVRTPLLLLLGAAGLVLLIACANVSTLQLARAIGQRQELAVRSALGAKPLRLVRQLLTESAMLAVISGILGVVLAAWAVPLLVHIASAQLPDVGAIGVNRVVLTLALIVSITSGLIVGTAPAVQALRAHMAATLRDDTAGAGQSAHQKRASSALVAGQIALTVVLLATAGLLTRSFLQLVRADRGYSADRVLVATMFIPRERYPASGEQREFARRTLESVQALPGVARAAVATGAPVVGGMSARVTTGAAAGDRDGRRMATWAVSSDYFALLGMSLRRGRLLEPNDVSEVVLDDAAARELFGAQDPIGKEVRWAIGSDTTSGTVVGVANNVQEFSIDTRDNSRVRSSDPHLFVPLATGIARPLRIIAQSQGDPVQLLTSVRRAVAAIDPQLPIDILSSMDEVESTILARERLLTLLMLLFAGIAFIIAAVGVYGVIAYSTARRTREFGIRVALGARRVDIIGLTLRHGTALVLVGIGLGIAGALAASRVLKSLLFEVSPTDPIVLLGVAAVLVLTALAASYGPARNALRVDPVTSLKRH